MSILQRSVKKAPMLSFRASPELRAKIKSLAEHYDVSQEYVLATLITFGVELDPQLEPIWTQVDAFAKSEGIPVAKALAQLAERGLRNKR